MENNIIGTLTILKTMGIKPNFSDLARAFGKDRHTIKKMYDGKEHVPRKKRASALDGCRDELERILSRTGTTIRAAHFYLRNEMGIECSYENLKSYVRRNGIAASKKAAAHPMYETEPGFQAQADWVEEMELRKTDGEPIRFNLFSATLGYSRLHHFEVTERKTEADFTRCLLNFYREIGGTCTELLTDNMSAVVSVSGGRRTVHPTVTQFFKDIGVRLRLCRVRSPETKGKDESSNRFAKWLQAYDGKIRDMEHLRSVVASLVRDCNRQPNDRTGIPPALLFEKEKEHLGPLPPERVMDQVSEPMRSCKVPSTFTITHKGARYSVPPNLITKTVEFKEEGGKLMIFHKGELVAEHQVRPKGTVNYDRGHYASGLGAAGVRDDDIESLAERNLAMFRDMEGGDGSE